MGRYELRSPFVAWLGSLRASGSLQGLLGLDSMRRYEVWLWPGLLLRAAAEGGMRVCLAAGAASVLARMQA